LKRLNVDFNVRGPEGTIKAVTRSAGLTLVPGEPVICCDPAEDGMTFAALVHSVRDGGVVLLDVDWSSTVETASAGLPSSASRSRGTPDRSHPYRAQFDSRPFSHSKGSSTPPYRVQVAESAGVVETVTA
jgi:hypothetical protein